MTIPTFVPEKQPTTDMPTTRAAAIAGKHTKYFTSKPCKKGHITYRYTASAICADCAHARFKRVGAKPPSPEARRKTNAKWNASNKAQSAKQRWKEKDPKNAWATYAVGSAKDRATRAEIAFNLDKDFIKNITPDMCPVFKTPFIFIGGKTLRPESPTIDRLYPERGYVKDNVIVISAKANAIKSNATADEIQRVADWLRSLLRTNHAN